MVVRTRQGWCRRFGAAALRGITSLGRKKSKALLSIWVIREPRPTKLPLLQHLPQERRGPANLALRYFFRRAGSHDLASEFAGFRTDIDEIIRFADYIQVVLNDYHGIAVINQPV